MQLICPNLNQFKNMTDYNKEREERVNKERAEREGRRAQEQSKRDERKEKEAAARGTRSSGPSKRQEAKEAAKEYGIDTRGMSTKEINSYVSEARSAEEKIQEDMLKFIEKSLETFSSRKKEDVSPSTVPPTVTSRITEDKSTPIPPVAAPSNKGGVIGGGGGGGNSKFPPDGWTTLKIAMCKDNNPVEATVLAEDPFAE
jgi:hypothetical protein